MKRNFRRNNRGQFVIIAALLVAVILVSTLITTYSSVRSQASGDQPQVLSTVDETNLALKQLLGFTVGYYGSILRVTGNTTYAQDLSSTYLNSGLENIADARPELGLSFRMSYLDLHVKWFMTSSYSYGQFNVTYDITSLGVYGLPYFLQSRLDMQVLPAVSGEPARVYLFQDGSEPMNTLTKDNFKLYRYLTNLTTWDLIPIMGDPQVFSNGTYLISIPSGYGVDSTTCILQVTDSRGIIVIGSAFNGYSAQFTWNSPFSSITQYVNQISSVDSSIDKGSHSNFENQKLKDNNNDALVEQNTGLNTEQFVSINSSNVDGIVSQGFQSNFTSQKYRDNINDTLTEKNTGSNTEQFVTQTSSVDVSVDKGTHSNFNALQNGPDSIYDTLTEQNTGSAGAITQRASSSSTSQGNTAVSIAKPSGTVQGDVMIANIYCAGSGTITVAPPSGWTLVSRTSVSTQIMATYFIVAGASEPSSYSWSVSGGQRNQGGISTYYGVDTSNPINAYNNQSNSASTSYTAPSVTTTVNNAMLVGAFGAKAGGAINTVTPPSGFNERYDIGQIVSTNRACLESSDYVQTSSGASGNKVATGSSGANIGHLIALKPAAPLYRLDLELQWTSVDYSETNEELCIRTGSFTNTEQLYVQAWNIASASWTNITGLNNLLANQWNNATISTYLSSDTFTIRFLDGSQVIDSAASTWQIDVVLVHTWSANNYVLDLEEQFTGVDFSQSNEYLCIYAASMGSEALRVDVYSVDHWDNLIPTLRAWQSNDWTNVSISSYLTSSTFTIRFTDSVQTGDTVQNSWKVDAVLVHTWSVNYELDLEEQFTGVDFSQSNEYLCIYAGSLGAESLMVQVRSGGSWVNVIPVLQANQWNNVSVSSYLTSSIFTFRFKGASDVDDLDQDIWQIDTSLLSLSSTIDPSSIQDSTIVVEWLQNGTLRMLGQGLQSTTQTNPIPPIPVKGFHLNQTFINGTNREVAFQIENWASSYSVPLGLTNNATVFSNIQMIVFLLTTDVSKVTIWWNGDDSAVQTPYAYLSGSFDDNPVVGGTLNNGRITLKFPSSGFNIQTTTVGGVQSTANFMRINSETSNYGAGYAFVVHHGVVRDVVQQEPEWNSGAGTANDCPNLYSSIVITLPARASYFTYQLRLTFINSASKPRTISDLSPIQLSTSLSSVQTQTENGTSTINPIVSTVTGTFVNYGGNASSHHWSQFKNAANAGTGILFTDNANQNLYFFDSKGTNPALTGAMNVSSSAIELAPVTSLRTVQGYNTPTGAEVVWNGAIATFDTNRTPVYNFENNSATGLWVLVEYSPIVAVNPIT